MPGVGRAPWWRLRAGLHSGCVLLVLAAAVLSGARDLAAQTAGDPCVYTDDAGQVVITDQLSDPHCAHMRPRPVFRVPGRFRVTFQVAELIALAHDAAETEGVDHRLVESIVEMESGYDPRAISSQGAMGLMQLMPGTASQYGVLDPFDPRQNLTAGVRHLRQLLLRYRSDLTMAVAAYNAGESAVDRYAGVPPYDETRTYVRRVLYRYRQRVEGARLHASYRATSAGR